MVFSVNKFIVFFFTFFFNKLYFNIFKVLRKYIFILPKSYSTYSIKKKFYYFGFLSLLCFLIFCKIYWFIYFYLVLFYKILFKQYINFSWLKKKNIKILYSVFWIYWFNLLIHLKVLSKKFQKTVGVDFLFFTLKWNSYYYFYYIIYMLKDLSAILIWLLLKAKYQLYILYIQMIFYLKNKKIEFIYYQTLFIKGILGIYCFSGVVFYIKNFNIIGKRNLSKKKRVSFFSKLKFLYHRSQRVIKESFYSKVTKPKLLFSYFISNLIENVFFIMFKTGANSIIYYFYKIIKYSYSICVYIWKSDIIYRFFKLIERKKW